MSGLVSVLSPCFVDMLGCLDPSMNYLTMGADVGQPVIQPSYNQRGVHVMMRSALSELDVECPRVFRVSGIIYPSVLCHESLDTLATSLRCTPHSRHTTPLQRSKFNDQIKWQPLDPMLSSSGSLLVFSSSSSPSRPRNWTLSPSSTPAPGRTEFTLEHSVTLVLAPALVMTSRRFSGATSQCSRFVFSL